MLSSTILTSGSRYAEAAQFGHQVHRRTCEVHTTITIGTGSQRHCYSSVPSVLNSARNACSTDSQDSDRVPPSTNQMPFTAPLLAVCIRIGMSMPCGSAQSYTISTSSMQSLQLCRHCAEPACTSDFSKQTRAASPRGVRSRRFGCVGTCTVTLSSSNGRRGSPGTYITPLAGSATGCIFGMV